MLLLPILKYQTLDKSEFERMQIDKLFEEIKEFRLEKDYIKRANELIDIIQVCLSLLNLFDTDILTIACGKNYEKHQKRNIYEILGNIKIIIDKK